MADKRLDQTTNASAVAAADNIPFVTAAGVTSYVTGDELAASGPFSSRYKPLASDRVWVPGTAFATTLGSSVVGTLGNGSTGLARTTAMLFDASVTESAVTFVAVPPQWATAEVKIWWSNAGAGAGDVVWRVELLNVINATDTNVVGASGENLTATAPAQYVTAVAQVISSVSLTAGATLRVAVRRTATDAADTLANDAGLLGIELVRVS